MLVLQRKVGESLYIGEEVKVTVISLEAGRVRLAIDAPQDVTILRTELKVAMDTNRESALEPSSLTLNAFVQALEQRHPEP